jgi:hypothetical protein
MNPKKFGAKTSYVVGLIASALVGAHTSGQQQPAPSPPTIQVYSRETLVDVTVTDANG